MNTQQWEQTCRAGKCEILKKQTTPHGNVLLAERKVRDPADGTQVWETLWAIERDGMDIAQAVRNPVMQERNGIWRSTDTPHDRTDRIKETVGVAIQFMKDNCAVGRYT